MVLYPAGMTENSSSQFETDHDNIRFQANDLFSALLESPRPWISICRKTKNLFLLCQNISFAVTRAQSKTSTSFKILQQKDCKTTSVILHRLFLKLNCSRLGCGRILQGFGCWMKSLNLHSQETKTHLVRLLRYCPLLCDKFVGCGIVENLRLCSCEQTRNDTS